MPRTRQVRAHAARGCGRAAERAARSRALRRDVDKKGPRRLLQSRCSTGGAARARQLAVRAQLPLIPSVRPACGGGHAGADHGHAALVVGGSARAIRAHRCHDACTSTRRGTRCRHRCGALAHAARCAGRRRRRRRSSQG
eukprot:386040-Pleurochrysis_carterae.AAC.1